MSSVSFKAICTVPREGPPIYHDGSLDYWECMERFNRKRNANWAPPVVQMPELVLPKAKTKKKGKNARE